MEREHERSYRVAVVGATGAVGTVMRAKLRERNFPASEIVPFASERSAGRELDGAIVQPLTDETIQGFDLAIFSAGGVDLRRVGAALRRRRRGRGRQLAPSGGATPRSRSWSPRSTRTALEDHKGLIANPNCSTMQLMVALKPIYDAAGIERLIVSTYQSVSGTGVKAVEELESQTRAVLHGEPLPAPQVYPHPIAFNVHGGAGNFAVDDHTDEERKMMFETRKILGDESIAINVTCARVPVRNCHSESVTLQTREPLERRGGARPARRGCPA